jgi:hypothetical protein
MQRAGVQAFAVAVGQRSAVFDTHTGRQVRATADLFAVVIELLTHRGEILWRLAVAIVGLLRLTLLILRLVMRRLPGLLMALVTWLGIALLVPLAGLAIARILLLARATLRGGAGEAAGQQGGNAQAGDQAGRLHGVAPCSAPPRQRDWAAGQRVLALVAGLGVTRC